MADGPDYALRSAVQALEGMVVRLRDDVSAVGNGVATVHHTTQETKGDLASLRRQFEAFVQQAERTANVQRAETRRGVLQQELEAEFGHHKKVRRSAVGMLQGFDTGLVSEDVVRDISEQLMMQTPRYWLAPALVALAAWVGNDRSLAERAVLVAYQRSHEKTALFFALVTRRQNRLDSSLRWLASYLATQDPNTLGRDFAVVLEAVSQGAFGPAARDLIHNTLDEWRTRLLDNEGLIHQQVGMWRAEIDFLTSSTPTPGYPNLGEMSPEWAALDKALRRAQTHRRLIDKYLALLKAEFTPSRNLEDAIDDILDRLVQEYDVDELPKRRLLAVTEAIIDCGGDMQRANQQAGIAAAALDMTLDYLTIETSAALKPDSIGVSPATQRMAIGASADRFKRAHMEFTRDYRAGVPASVSAQVTLTQPVASRSFSLPAWSGSFTSPLADLESSLASHWDTHLGPFLDSLRYKTKDEATKAGLIIGGLFLLLLFVNPGFAFLAALIGGGLWALSIKGKHDQSLKDVAQAQVVLHKLKQESLQRLRAARAELTDWQMSYRRADEDAASAASLIEEFRSADHGSSHHDGRLVGVK